MWYLVLSHSLPEKEEMKQRNYDDHRDWLEEQHRAGRLLFSGPTADRAYGIYVMLASSLSEAKALAGQDPASRQRYSNHGSAGVGPAQGLSNGRYDHCRCRADGNNDRTFTGRNLEAYPEASSPISARGDEASQAAQAASRRKKRTALPASISSFSSSGTPANCCSMTSSERGQWVTMWGKSVDHMILSTPTW